MAEYIERERITFHIAQELEFCGEADPSSRPVAYGCANGLKAALSYANDIPAADVVEVRHGYWKEIQGEIGNPFDNQVFDTIDLFGCSVCGEIFDVSEARNYCPNCGAKMDGKDGEDK